MATGSLSLTCKTNSRPKASLSFFSGEHRLPVRHRTDSPWRACRCPQLAGNIVFDAVASFHFPNLAAHLYRYKGSATFQVALAGIPWHAVVPRLQEGGGCRRG